MLRATSRAGQFSATIAKILSSPFPGRITCGLFNQMPLLSHLPQIITFFGYRKVIGKTWLVYCPVCLFVYLFVCLLVGLFVLVVCFVPEFLPGNATNLLDPAAP